MQVVRRSRRKRTPRGPMPNFGAAPRPGHLPDAVRGNSTKHYSNRPAHAEIPVAIRKVAIRKVAIRKVAPESTRRLWFRTNRPPAGLLPQLLAQARLSRSSGTIQIQPRQQRPWRLPLRLRAAPGLPSLATGPFRKPISHRKQSPDRAQATRSARRREHSRPAALFVRCPADVAVALTAREASRLPHGLYCAHAQASSLRD